MVAEASDGEAPWGMREGADLAGAMGLPVAGSMAGSWESGMAASFAARVRVTLRSSRAEESGMNEAAAAAARPMGIWKAARMGIGKVKAAGSMAGGRGEESEK